MSPLWFRTALLPDGWADSVRLRIAGGRIGAIEVGVDAAAADERYEIGLPGLPNLHSHAFQRAMAGLTESARTDAEDFWTWREVLYRLVDAIGPDELEAVTAFAFMEMLETGFTRVGEFHYLHHDRHGREYSDVGELAVRVAAAAQETGIGLTLLPVMYAYAGFGRRLPEPGQRRFINDPDSFERIVAATRRAVATLEQAIVGIAPHSLRAVGPEELKAAIDLSGTAPVHMHAAEQMREVHDCLAWSGRRPVEWLLDHAGVDRRWCLVHATHVTPDESRRLAASGAVVGLCPVTEANLGDGIFPARDYLNAGGSLGIGSDSNVLIDPAEELRLLEYTQRLTFRERNVLASAGDRSTGRRLYEAALGGGARALGVARVGLVPGAAADLVSLDARHPSLAGRRADAILDSLIFAGRGTLTDCVWRAGRRLVCAGRHFAHDRIVERYRRAIGRLPCS